MKCYLCPRNCGVERDKGEYGFCGVPWDIMAARAAKHFWEEPCISGENGSGTVFFSGCSLGCVYCQNKEISRGVSGKTVSVEQLSDIFLRLQSERSNNINLVTPSHYVPHIIKALIAAKKNGLKIPVVYNTSAYEKVETLKSLEGLVDIYLPDLKYFSFSLAQKYSKASDYFDVASKAIAEMVRQVGEPRFFENDTICESGIMKKGVIIRHLVLPSGVDDSKDVLKYIYNTYGNKVFVSIMSQYTPVSKNIEFQELQRKITAEEYESVIDYAAELGIENGFIQDGETADESFIPSFDNSGL